ncbi:MAG: hypothetical protein KC649_07730 [Candidatus Omnitrophica bacterium]|nr:hypothetical protein [Candidatus Omnitrophota bacterium]
MTNSLRILRAAALSVAVLLAASSLLPICFYIPASRDWIYARVLRTILPEGSSWRKFDAFSPDSCQIYRLHLPITAEANLISDLTVFNVDIKLLRATFEMSGIMSHPQLFAARVSDEPIEFYEGKFDISRTRDKTIIRLNEWAAKSVFFDAEFTLGKDYEMQSGFIRGLADQNDLQKLLKRWKTPSLSDADVMKKFYIEWSKTHISIMLDGKPFFKAGWKFSEA